MTNDVKPHIEVGEKRVPEYIRADILARVRSGAISPEQAEVEWKPVGWGPLAYEPPHDRHDPFKAPHWTLSMALAWIVTRDIKTVMWFDDHFRAKVLQWRDDGDGWYLKTLEPMTMIVGEMELEADPSVGPDLSSRRRLVADSNAELISNLANGSITATAIAAGKAVVTIPAHERPRIVVCMDRSRDYLGYEHNLSPVYWRAQMPTSQLLKCWGRKSAANAKAQTAAEAQQGLGALMAASPTSKTITKDAWIADVGRKLKLSPTKAKTIWNSCSGKFPAWRRSGPTPGHKARGG